MKVEQKGNKIFIDADNFVNGVVISMDQARALFRQLAALPGMLPSDEEVEEAMKVRSGDFGFYSDERIFTDGAKWALNKLKGE